MLNLKEEEKDLPFKHENEKFDIDINNEYHICMMRCIK